MASDLGMSQTGVEEPTALIDALPGVKMSVKDVTRELSLMWSTGNSGERPPEDFRASQLNLVLHLGLATTAIEARDCFDRAVTFAQTHPCRIIVLCPMGRERDERLLEAKLYGECFLGEGLREMCCCEALILGYPTRESGFLANQVSTWLEADLPVYYWVHRVPAERLAAYHHDFIERCRRVVFDGQVEGTALAPRDFPKPDRVVDLALARLLAVRQSLGQFLSGYAPSVLVEGLTSVAISARPGCSAEAHALASWLEGRLAACAPKSAGAVPISPENAPAHEENPSQAAPCQVVVEINAPPDHACLLMVWHYADRVRFLRWQLRHGDEASIEASLDGTTTVRSPLPAAILSPVKALSEALFFF